MSFLILPPDRGSVGEELVVEEEVRGVDGGEGDDEVGHLAPEEDEGVHVELVVHVLLELPQHPTHLLLGVVDHSPSGPCAGEKKTRLVGTVVCGYSDTLGEWHKCR